MVVAGSLTLPDLPLTVVAAGRDGMSKRRRGSSVTRLGEVVPHQTLVFFWSHDGFGFWRLDFYCCCQRDNEGLCTLRTHDDWVCCERARPVDGLRSRRLSHKAHGAKFSNQRHSVTLFEGFLCEATHLPPQCFSVRLPSAPDPLLNHRPDPSHSLPPLRQHSHRLTHRRPHQPPRMPNLPFRAHNHRARLLAARVRAERA